MKNIMKTIKDIIKRLIVGKSYRTNRLSYYKTKTGNYYLPKDAHADNIAKAIIKNRIFEEPVYLASKNYIKPGSVVLDVGSNFGQMAILFSKLVGDSGYVHAFEADDFVFEILQKNAAENSKNIITHFGAVHNVSGETLHFPIQDFQRFGAYGAYGIDYKNNKGRPVKTIAIDDLVFELPISFMKVDVQGGGLICP